MTDGEAREMARGLVRGSIIEDAASQFIAQVLKEAHDSRIKPLRDRIEELEAKLARESDALLMLHAAVVEALQPHADLTRLANVSATLAELKGGKDEWADVSQSNYQQAKAAEAQLAKLIGGAETVLEAWDSGNEAPFREAIEELRADVAEAKGDNT